MQADVHKGQIRRDRRDGGERGGHSGGLAANQKIRLLVDEVGQPLANKWMIVHEKYFFLFAAGIHG